MQENKEEGTSNGWCKGKQHFRCENNCAVFVSVDKLTDPKTASAAKLVQNSKPEDEIKMGSLVKFFDINNDYEKGIVRWIGSDNSSVPSNTKIIGIEAVSYSYVL